MKILETCWIGSYVQLFYVDPVGFNPFRTSAPLYVKQSIQEGTN